MLFTPLDNKGKSNAKNKGNGKTQLKADIKKDSMCFFCKKKGHIKKDYKLVIYQNNILEFVSFIILV